MVLWLIGVSGAGKTTLGKCLCDALAKEETAYYMLDGDEVRAVFDGDLGFSREDREANIKRIILAAYVLDKCGTTAIVCNISPFEELRALAREKIAGYNEIYLKKDIDISISSDVKKMYATHSGKTEIVGLDIDFDEPIHADLTIDVDSESVEDSAARIWEYYERRKENATSV